MQALQCLIQSLAIWQYATCLLRLVGRIVVIKFGVLLDAFVIVHPPTVRNRDVAVPAVRCSQLNTSFGSKVYVWNGLSWRYRTHIWNVNIQSRRMQDIRRTWTVQDNTCLLNSTLSSCFGYFQKSCIYNKKMTQFILQNSAAVTKWSFPVWFLHKM